MSPVVLRTTGFSDYLDERSHIKELILGAPGAGKTRSASFWPRPVFINCEGGEMAIADRKVPIFDITSPQDMQDVLRTVQLESMKKDRRWDTVVVDTLDAYQRTVIQNYLKTNNKMAMSGWADWGYLDGVMAQLMNALQNLSMNVVVNLHVKESMEGDEEDGTKQRVYSPKLKGDLRDQITVDFDFVGFMSVDYVAVDGKRALKRSVKWMPEPRYPFLKDRSGQLPPITDIDFTDEDYGRLLAALLAGMDKLEDVEILETIGEAEPAAVAPVAAKVGGPIADASTVAAPRRTPAKAAVAPVAAPVPETAPAVAETAPAVPLAAVPPPAPVSVPVGVKPAPAGAPAGTAAATTVPPAEPIHDTTTSVVAQAEPAVSEEQAIAALQEGLGAEVLSAPDQVDAPAHEGDDAGQPGTEHVAVLEAKETAAASPVAPPGAPKSLLDYNCGDQPPSLVGVYPAAAGCGALLSDTDATVDRLQITSLKARTLLCPACFVTFKQAS